jgi:hypothetical protein
METTLFTRQHEGVTHQLTLHNGENRCEIIQTLKGQWNKIQRISLRHEYLQTIDRRWEEIITGKGETFSIVDVLDQEQQHFEVVHVTRSEQQISLYRATPSGVENCTLAQRDLRDILDHSLPQCRVVDHLVHAPQRGFSRGS